VVASADDLPVFLSEKQDMLKLGDFGLSKNLGGQMFTQTYVGVRAEQFCLTYRRDADSNVE
jgi:hypothetical protein